MSISTQFATPKQHVQMAIKSVAWRILIQCCIRHPRLSPLGWGWLPTLKSRYQTKKTSPSTTSFSLYIPPDCSTTSFNFFESHYTPASYHRQQLYTRHLSHPMQIRSAARPLATKQPSIADAPLQIYFLPGSRARLLEFMLLPRSYTEKSR